MGMKRPTASVRIALAVGRFHHTRHPCPASFAKLASGTSNHNPHLAGDTNSAPNPCPGVYLRTNPDASR